VSKYQASGYGITTDVFEFRHGRHIFIIDVKDIVFAASKLQFLFRIEEIKGQKVYSLESKLSKNLIPEISFGMSFFKRSWYGPDNALTNITFSEFIHAETAYDKLITSGDDKYLNRLVAILYRPSGNMKPKDPEFRGDVRRAFNDFTIDRQAKRAFFIQDNIKTAILIYYIGCRYAITKTFPDVFSGSGSEKTDTYRSYMNLVEVLANYDVTKKDDIRSAYLYDVLLTLNQSIIRDKETEKKFKKLKNA
jgi:hypothetical protein